MTNPDGKCGNILVSGGAGYIGLHVVHGLLDAGFRVIVADDLSTGVRHRIPAAATFIETDVGRSEFMTDILNEHDVSAVIHMAGEIIVPESVANPLHYYRRNTETSRSLLQSCVAANVGCFLFSSTAAVYGEVPEGIVDETSPTTPINPYGRSKLMTEWMLQDSAKAHGLTYTVLRYFNVAGADPQGRCGQDYENATHLIKVACEVALGKREAITIFGSDYDTPDGTCIRDYIHVTDLARAHVLALKRMLDGAGSIVMNCGYGHGYSVREVLAAVAQETNEKLNVIDGPRRLGDPAQLISRAVLIRQELNWQPEFENLDKIVGSALDWERSLGFLAQNQE